MKLCPWLGLKVDERIPLKLADSARYSRASLEYVFTIGARAGVLDYPFKELDPKSPCTAEVAEKKMREESDS